MVFRRERGSICSALSTPKELVHTSDPYTKLQPGTKGTVEFVDDVGTIQISWDNGSGLGMIPGEDEVRKL